jgi:hypothetical protein
MRLQQNWAEGAQIFMLHRLSLLSGQRLSSTTDSFMVVSNSVLREGVEGCDLDLEHDFMLVNEDSTT